MRYKITKQTNSQSENFVPDKTMCSGAYILAHAAGELHGKAVRQYLKDFQEAEGNIVKHIQLMFYRLQDLHALSKSEVLHLNKILALLKNSQASSADALKVVRDVHHALVDEEASACAVAMGGIAENSVCLAIETKSAETEMRGPNWWHVLGADLAGAGAGAIAGSAVPAVGTAVGAICGAAVASGKALEAS